MRRLLQSRQLEPPLMSEGPSDVTGRRRQIDRRRTQRGVLSCGRQRKRKNGKREDGNQNEFVGRERNCESGR